MAPDLTPEGKLQLLGRNYWHLFDLYRRGWFESDVEPDKFTFYQRRPEPVTPDRKKRVQTLKPAADDLYALACALAADSGALHPTPREEAAEMILRAWVLSYEIDDYFLNIEPPKARVYVGMAKEVCADVHGYFARHYGFVSDSSRQKSVVQYLLLAALCGINELYRQHNKDDYEEGIRLGEQVLAYIRVEMPRLPSPPTSGRGVLGLCCYIMGRLYFASSAYQKAEAYFRESVEAYSERIQLNSGETLPSILATVRRCALASTFGNAYIALVDGRVHDALTLSALACSVLKHNCGEVYAAYAELIYWTAKRAEASSDRQTVRKVKRNLRRCRRVFKLYVPDAHYVHRADIELGIVYHYLALAEPGRKKRYYDLATSLLKQAITFAEADVGGRPHNQRMLAESFIVLSHITINCRPDDIDAALRLAERALVAAEGIKQFTCEANLALAAIYSAAAKKSALDAQKAEHILNARLHANKALELNQNTNALISGAGYLRMADLSLLQPNTLTDVRHYYERWQAVSGLVEHDTLRQWAAQIGAELLNVNQHLFVNPSESLRYQDWKSRIEEHLANAAMRELAEELRAGAGAAGGEEVRRHTDKTLIRDFLEKRSGLARQTAYEWIKKFRLEEKLRQYRY